MGRQIVDNVKWLREEGLDWFLEILGCYWRFTDCLLRIVGESTSLKLVTLLGITFNIHFNPTPASDF